MVDIFMLILVIIISIIILIINIYLLAYYCTEDDNNYGSGLITKFIVILGLFIAFGQICLLPLDVSNTRGEGGNFRMDLIWKITYILIFSFSFFIIPFTISIYECGPDLTFKQKLSKSFCFYFCEIIVVMTLLSLSFLFLGKAHIPITSIQCEFIPNDNNWINSNEEIKDEEEIFKSCEKNNKEIELVVSFIIYIIGLLSFISYFFFMLFGGVGIFSFPLDLIYSFCTRPIKLEINDSKLEEKKQEIALFAADLKDYAMKLKALEKNGDHEKFICNKKRKNYDKLLKKLKVGVSIIEDKYEIINIQNYIKKNGAFIYLLKLIGGLLSLLLSIAWILQIIFYLIIKKEEKPFFVFINIALVKLTDINLSFVSIGLYTLFSLYLLLITIKGHLKFGLRIIFLGEIHPMKKNNTYMNSILFNVILIMITSVSVVQYSVRTFGEYTSFSDSVIFFNTVIKYLSFFRLLLKYNIFEFGFFFIAFISFLYLICRPNDIDTLKKMLYKKYEIEKMIKDNQIRLIMNKNEN